MSAIGPAIGVVSGLIAAYVSLQTRALMSDVRRELAELENRIIERINGKYISRAENELQQALMRERIEGLVRQDRRLPSK